MSNSNRGLKSLILRFIKDVDYPIPFVSIDIFIKEINEKYACEYKKLWVKLLQLVHDKYNGSYELFLDHYYHDREEIITTLTTSSAYQNYKDFDNASFYETLNIDEEKVSNLLSSDIYNQESIGNTYISLDLKHANTQVLPYICPKFFGEDNRSYDEFIKNITDIELLQDSKHARVAMFGCKGLNPNKQIKATKAIMRWLYCDILENSSIFQRLKIIKTYHQTDELIFQIDPNCLTKPLIRRLNEITELHGFKVKCNVFKLRGFALYNNDKEYPQHVFYGKEFLPSKASDKTAIKYKCIPGPLYKITYRLLNEENIQDIDRYIGYDACTALLTDDFSLTELFGPVKKN